MPRENDRIDARIGCLLTERIPATLISTTGFHCDVWHAVGTVIRGGERSPIDVIIKVPHETRGQAEVRALHREHRLLRDELGRIVPDTVFVATRINGQPSVVVLCEAVRRWFDVANPANEPEAVPLFRRLRRARDELERFVAAANRWDEADQRVIDLYGLENLVLDADRRLRYVDSFRVFFYAELLHAIGDPDPVLEERIALARQRRDYLAHLLRASARRPGTPAGQSAGGYDPGRLYKD